MHWNEIARDGAKKIDLDDRYLVHEPARSNVTPSNSPDRTESLGGHIMRLAQMATAMHLGQEAQLQCAAVVAETDQKAHAEGMHADAPLPGMFAAQQESE